MEQALQRNNTSFPSLAAARLRALYKEYRAAQKDEDRDAGVLKYYQYLVRAVMTRPEYGIGADGNGRGLLVYYSMGMGKTMLAVACAMAMWDVRAPIVIAPKSLHRNMRGTVAKLTRLLDPAATPAQIKSNQARFRYVSLDAHNMAKQVARETTGVEGAGSLTGRLLIIDEAHTFFRAIINSPNDLTNARQLYGMIMAAKNLRILFLTGTPSSKDPFELVPCFNMLAGEVVLPSTYDVFYDSYVGEATGPGETGLRLKNRGKLANRLLGLVTHVSPGRPTHPVAGDEEKSAVAAPRETGWYPEVLEPQVVRIEMSPDQYRKYLQAREEEEKEKGGPGGKGPGNRIPRGSPALALPSAASNAGSTYYNRSRNLSNFSPAPEHGEAVDVDRLPDAAFDAESSPKAAHLVEALSTGPAPALVYSQYVGMGGLGVISRFLRKAGWRRFTLGPGDAPEDTASNASAPRFAVISGEVSPDDRDRIVKACTAPGNKHGGVIRALLVSVVGALGLDLKNIRRVYKFEPYWDKSLEDQVDARATRMGSHDDLPAEERDVQSFLYLATANSEVLAGVGAGPEGAPARPVETETINERFHRRALARAALNNDARKFLREISLECGVNNYGDCRVCVPTDAPLFHAADPLRDLRMADPCEPLVESDVEAREVELGGEKYYRRDAPGTVFGAEFFVWSAALDAFTPVDPATPLFHRLLAAP